MHEHCSQILAAAAARGKELGLPYAGAVMPAEAWELVKALQATLLDVRTIAERQFVGAPPESISIEWRMWPGMEINPDFAREAVAQIPTDRPVVLLCRSGVRSHAAAECLAGLGYTAFNILEGFEGDRDAAGQRGQLGGWRRHGLPWSQG
ncbi:rhodanese-like domain-containing protein [Laribacter hongkongensis]|uniref:rhodanese-like domain-containing protein n=2 Tax=Laribacter hongkongensis TaxID=168471 RepID=UPI001EFE4738|nr:rhodanese-like domain-containing protein [Laribacter hongkongensis]MCG8992462.1 rhodanese-like domain-containing protein [Laribacter hongkongensis]MCG8998094.1 rhodanese-like domain-containing protein [Laribacter hongkongensis]MCG8999932.1 rhodanese-like domain-containing protein [Laribacter hongkongensis]MCG9004295.1 rhodanese-like domain-containing protein [Laribacter hongkongensis]MCG9007635.1 rhodanese-like domain-containing protein [Laribacter hongkongensis]